MCRSRGAVVTLPEEEVVRQGREGVGTIRHFNALREGLVSWNVIWFQTSSWPNEHGSPCHQLPDREVSVSAPQACVFPTTRPSLCSTHSKQWTSGGTLPSFIMWDSQIDSIVKKSPAEAVVPSAEAQPATGAA